MWVVPVVAFAGCLVLDALAGRWHRRGRLARPHVTLARSGRPQQVIVAFPGYTMAGHLLSAAFAPCLGEDDAMIVVQYAERGIDVEQIYQAVMVKVARIGAPRLRVYGGSMGGMCAKHFLDRYHRDGAPCGKVVLLVDTSPTHATDVKRPRWLMALGRWYRGGPARQRDLVDAQLAGAAPGRRAGSRSPGHQRLPPRHCPGRATGHCHPGRLHRRLLRAAHQRTRGRTATTNVVTPARLTLASISGR